jgi:hypothetical protein
MSHTHLDGTSRVGRLGAPKAHLRLSCEHDCDVCCLLELNDLVALVFMLRDTCTPSIDQGLPCGVGKLGSSSNCMLDC